LVLSSYSAMSPLWWVPKESARIWAGFQLDCLCYLLLGFHVDSM
jgi:hypothetical protein